MNPTTILLMSILTALLSTPAARACGYGPAVPGQQFGLAWAEPSDTPPALFMREHRVVLGFLRQIKRDASGWTGQLSRPRHNDGVRPWRTPTRVRIERPERWPLERPLGELARTGNLVLLTPTEGRRGYRLVAYTAHKQRFRGQWFEPQIRRLYSPWSMDCPLLRQHPYKHTLRETLAGLGEQRGRALNLRLATLNSLGRDARPALPELRALLLRDLTTRDALWQGHTILRILMQIGDRSNETLETIQRLGVRMRDKNRGLARFAQQARAMLTGQPQQKK